MIGAPTFIARSMTLQIFSAYASDSDPPKTVKSWLKTKTSRPSIVPWPVTTPSPRTICASSPKSDDAMGDERVELDERVRIEQQVEALARRQLAAACCCSIRVFAAAEQRLGAHRLQPRDAFLVRRHAASPLAVFAQGQPP